MFLTIHMLLCFYLFDNVLLIEEVYQEICELFILNVVQLISIADTFANLLLDLLTELPEVLDILERDRDCTSCEILALNHEVNSIPRNS